MSMNCIALGILAPEHVRTQFDPSRLRAAFFISGKPMTDHEPMGISESEIEALTTEDKRWNWVLKQLHALNIRQSTQDVELANVKVSVAENTTITKQIAEDTAAMREAWADGVATKRFFCRLAQGWDFLLKKICIPVGITCVLWVIGRAVFSHEAIPNWAATLFKAFLGL